LIWTLGEMLALPMTNVLAADRAGEGNVGSYVGAYMMSFAIALVLAPMIGTTIYERLGPSALWFGCAVAGVVVSVGMRSLSGAFRGAAMITGEDSH
jgi:MFS family permease